MAKKKKKRREPIKYYCTDTTERGVGYKNYLKTLHWKNTRDKVLKRDNYMCALCNNNAAANIHHLTYENLGNENMDDLISLCRHCHNYAHHTGKIMHYDAAVGTAPNKGIRISRSKRMKQEAKKRKKNKNKGVEIHKLSEEEMEKYLSKYN